MIEAAVSDGEGDGRLAIDPANTGLSRLWSDRGGIDVRLRRLDSIVAEQALERVDLIKIDVEGQERGVFAGAVETLRRFRPAIVFESGLESATTATRSPTSSTPIATTLFAVLHDYGALDCSLDDYRAARGACRGSEARNILALPRPLLHRHALGEVARLVDIGAFGDGDVIGQKLHRDRVEQRRDERLAMRHLDADGEPAVAAARRPRRPRSSPPCRRAPAPPGRSTAVFSNSSSRGASTMTGTLSSISAIGPCFISPAA